MVSSFDWMHLALAKELNLYIPLAEYSLHQNLIAWKCQRSVEVLGGQTLKSVVHKSLGIVLLWSGFANITVGGPYIFL